MQRKQFVFLLFLIKVVVIDALCPSLPDNGRYWDEDYKKGKRCILRCRRGYEPDGCYVLRETHNGWNYDVPECVEKSSVSSSLVTAAATGVVTAIAAPFALPALGFGAGGVVAGTLAAWLQGPATAAGSWFALSQSAGVVGMAATTKAGIGAAVGVAKAAYDSRKCERE